MHSWFTLAEDLCQQWSSQFKSDTFLWNFVSCFNLHQIRGRMCQNMKWRKAVINPALLARFMDTSACWKSVKQEKCIHDSWLLQLSHSDLQLITHSCLHICYISIVWFCSVPTNPFFLNMWMSLEISLDYRWREILQALQNIFV